MRVRNPSRLRRLLHKTSCGATVNPYAITFMLTEMEFRGPLFRVAEIVYAAFYLLVLRRDPTVTLGHCQVSFQYWRQKYGRRNILLLLGATNAKDSYDVCQLFLENNRRESLKGLLIRYTGMPSCLYAELFAANLIAVRRCMNETGLQPTQLLPEAELFGILRSSNSSRDMHHL
jgi:hypothetical protein